MEEKFNTDAKLKELHTKIGALEMEVTSMRNQAWELRLAGGTNGGSGEWEEIKNEQEIGQGGHAGAD
ncbi:hypothetical protein A1O7_03979 [Cladophialophora yegresii CBS 114405]|uniref:Uncharacterized protein n=1 Tax=Cladophialophora yegresii CBS 114405 TaxID=1182544 RepID=W9VVN7_9EURO|nr:uncharacterized protein A1O7_03979 [Cladophialophora yegresii CBS 114405]EXJ59832.1 hypothetical protein A1O7_03979 [Cladophialophora yegresii CBS 114405]